MADSVFTVGQSATEQPSGPSELIRDHPLFEGLVFAINGGEGPLPVELVSGKIPTIQGVGSYQPVPTKYGLAASRSVGYLDYGRTGADDVTVGTVFWIAESTSSTGTPYFFGSGENSNGYGFQVALDNSQQVNNGFLLNGNNGSQANSGFNALQSWRQSEPACFTWDGANIRAHAGRGGALKSTTANSFVATPSGARITRLAQRSNVSTDIITAAVGVVLVWDRVLSPAELKLLFSNPWLLFREPRPVPIQGSGGGSLASVITEAAAANDSSWSSLSSGALVSESTSAIDSAYASAAVVATQNEVAFGTESQAAFDARFGAASEAAAATEQASAQLATSGQAIEAASAADSASASTTAGGQAVAEVAVAADTAAAQLVTQATQLEPASAADSASAGRASSVSIAEAATAVEAQDWVGSTAAGVVEAVAASDACSATVVRSAAVSEAALALDLSAASCWTSASITELANASDLVIGTLAGDEVVDLPLPPAFFVGTAASSFKVGPGHGAVRVASVSKKTAVRGAR